MIRLESGGSDRTMEAGFKENSVYSTYTPTTPVLRFEQGKLMRLRMQVYNSNQCSVDQ